MSPVALLAYYHKHPALMTCCLSSVSSVQRAPDKQPPVVISLAFTGLALVPLGILLIALTQMGVNFQVRSCKLGCQ
jgi:hypothetical protein